MNNSNLYLVIAVIGFLAPNILVVIESVETGNLLLYTQPGATVASMFANRISSIFMIDLLIVLLVFFIWSYLDSRRKEIKLGWVWLLTLLFGLGGGFPLYLYYRAESKSETSPNATSN